MLSDTLFWLGKLHSNCCLFILIICKGAGQRWLHTWQPHFQVQRAHMQHQQVGPRGSSWCVAVNGDIVQSVRGREGDCYSLRMLVMKFVLLLLQFFFCLIGFCFVSLVVSSRHILAFLMKMENSYVITFAVPIMYSFTVRRRVYFLFFIDSNNISLQQ